MTIKDDARSAANLTKKVDRQFGYFLVLYAGLYIFKADLANVVFHKCPRDKNSAL